MSKRESALCAYVEKLTLTPAAVREEDIAALRAAGLGDEGILDLAHVAGFFAYANRIADGLGIEREPPR